VRFLVVGTMAWDIPIWLKGTLASGKRIKGTTQDGRFNGRLGGGGANASCALLGAGHDVRLVSVVSNDEQGRLVMASARRFGIPMEFLTAHDVPSSKTFIFIDKEGERTIVGLDHSEVPARTDLVARSMPGQVKIDAFAPAGVYLRQLYAGIDGIDFGGAVVVAHWPMFVEHRIDADVLVASENDLEIDSVEAFFDEVRHQVSERLAWVVLTHGGRGVSAFNGREKIEYATTSVAQKDSTGAGDVFAAGLMEALAHGADMRAAIVHASGWGAIAVSLNGSAADPEQQPLYQAFGC